MTAYKCIASEARPREDPRFTRLAPRKQRLREEKVLYYQLVCTTVRTTQLRSINPPDTVSCMYYGTNYATTVNQSTRYSFSYVLRYELRNYGQSIHQVQFLVCTTVLRNYALPIHKNEFPVYVLRYYATTLYLSTRISFFNMYCGTT